jgi:hypothetical protein
MAGGQQSSQTIQKSDPWAPQQPYLKTGFKEAQNLLEAPTPKYYPGTTIPSFSPETQTALGMQTNRALSGSPVTNAANNQLTSTLNGDYLYGGQGFNAAFDAAAHKILPQVNSQFEGAGRTGSGLAATAQTQALGDAFASQYGNERENQMRSMLFAPSMANQDYTDISKLAEVGAQREDLSGQQMGEQKARYDYNQNARAAQVADYLNMIQGNYGGTTTSNTTQSAPSNGGFLGALGGLFQGGYGASMSGINPFLGAGLGLLGGLF